MYIFELLFLFVMRTIKLQPEIKIKLIYFCCMKNKIKKIKLANVYIFRFILFNSKIDFQVLNKKPTST